jgi:TctA family transporter
MSDNIIVEIDCSTGISTEREMTTEEIQAMSERQAEFESQQAANAAASEAKAEAKASAEAKLLALGLTSEEIAALSN